MPKQPPYRMPAEWERHRATWIAWPHEESDWPEKIPAVEWVYAEIARLLSLGEMVEILCDNLDVRSRAEYCLKKHHVSPERYRLHHIRNDRGWLRDSAPTCIRDSRGGLLWICWHFNAWARYDNFSADTAVARSIAEVSGLPFAHAIRPDTAQPLVLEGGAIETDGEGTLLVTEECLLSPVQERNPGLKREQYEEAFRSYLGIEKTIWLSGSVEGDDTHGHIDDVARFVGPGKIALAYETDSKKDNGATAGRNLERLQQDVDARGRKLEIVLLPMPREVYCGAERLPASYANFYISNAAVIVPTFNDEHDRKALEVLAACFPGRKVIGLHAVDLILGQGAVHCLTQQEYERGS